MEKKAKREALYIGPVEGCTKCVVGIDPGKSDLIYCSSGEGRNEKFRYTQNQRRFETREKKHRKKRKKLAEERVEGKTVTEWETSLSLLNKKTLGFEAAKAYFTKKNEVNGKLFQHYEKKVYRALRWRACVNRRRSEDRTINRFREKIGKPEDVVLGWGDWSTGSRHMKFHEPTLGVGMRKLFTKAGYEVKLVNEFRTSCRCYNCQGGECKKFLLVENPRPWRRGKTPWVLRHGLLSCTNCERLSNRDRNGSLNIMRCAIAARQGKERPKYLRRDQRTCVPPTT